ncbi:putative arabinosidase [Aspergillus karnatakaensis]|uniref:glycoside hydrolase family 43 protein n=1 Tax=Aspergillus karnatakaensis TaxID=1810916 RepID=UPI003CCCFA2A
MRLLSSLLSTTSLLTLAAAAVLPRQDEPYVGYLLSTFTDVDPRVFWYLSDAENPLAFTPLNGGNPVLGSTVGTRAVRDIFLTTNDARSEFFVIATDLDINAPGFSWDEATRRGSRGLTIWRSENLIDWSEPTLSTIEDPTAGMAWAPSVVYNATESTYYLFWASRLYSDSDPTHSGTATLDRIRYTTTTDFKSFAPAADYLALDEEEIPLIDQEFLQLTGDGEEGTYIRFLKDELPLHVYQEVSTTGLSGQWTRSPSPENSGYIATSVFEGPAAFPDVNVPGRYYLLMDNYEQYVPFVTDDVLSGVWEELDLQAVGLPTGLKHGNVIPLTESEYGAVVGRYGS